MKPEPSPQRRLSAKFATALLSMSNTADGLIIFSQARTLPPFSRACLSIYFPVLVFPARCSQVYGPQKSMSMVSCSASQQEQIHASIAQPSMLTSHSAWGLQGVPSQRPGPTAQLSALRSLRR